jgi:hypothetical protein
LSLRSNLGLKLANAFGVDLKMISKIRFTLLIALVLAFISVLSAQENPNTKGGSITGRVTLANKGMAGVTVTISMSGDALGSNSKRCWTGVVSTGCRDPVKPSDSNGLI